MTTSINPTTRTGRSGRTLKVVAAVAAGLGIVGAMAASGIAIADDGSVSGYHASAQVSPAQSRTGTGTATTGQPASQGGSVAPQHPAVPAAVPSAAVASLQRELGQLNYYEGPDDGLTGPQTQQAIKDLQRVAGLPQTGVMDPATDSALIHQLTFGNSQMGGGA
ncbi:peptidoglycan-binding domain-containing protein [Gryllotalpicola koreensis]|uniref:Peptidoglycan binding-like domain-containing protein n=1 Tax=Gryllotalpicola koreensis TaxID=993086 RepID=A0ABP7ZXB2_9MICO